MMHSYCPSARPATFRRAFGTGRSASLVTGTGSRSVSGLHIACLEQNTCLTERGHVVRILGLEIPTYPNGLKYGLRL
jgi:hypothetical protein